MTEVLTHWLAGDDYTASGGGFMGKTWDSFVPGPATWNEVYRVLKPGGHMIVFSGTRTWDIATLAIRLAGFEIRDGLMWLYGSGFPKSMDVSKALDKAAGAEREVVGSRTSAYGTQTPGGVWADRDSGGPGLWVGADPKEVPLTGVDPVTDAAQRWSGWGTALKPAWEPIVLARKPFKGTVAANVLAHGTGALNIDATRIGYQSSDDMDSATPQGRPTAKVGALAGGTQNERERTEFHRPELKGRFPANIVLSHTERCVQTGVRKVKAITGTNSGRGSGKYAEDSNVYGTYAGRTDMEQGAPVGLGDADGMETVETWECADDCPVKALDDQTAVKSPGRFPANVVLSHTERCVRVGEREIQSTGHYPSARPGTTTITTDGHAGQEGLVESYTKGEVVEDWECADDCPVKALDEQTAVKAPGRFPANLVLSHTEACVQRGTKQIRPSNGSGRASEQSGGIGGGMFGDGTPDKIGGSFVDADGTETVEDWECAEGCPIKALDDQTGILTSGNAVVGTGAGARKGQTYAGPTTGLIASVYADKGGASRFFYCAKVAKSERNQGMPTGIVNNHPTVKPIALMDWLIKLITPPGGTVLDPFVGSGSTGIAAVRNGHSFIGLDDDPESIAIARYRLLHEGVDVEVLGQIASDVELSRDKKAVEA